MATKSDLKELEYRLVIKLSVITGGIVSLAIAATAAITKLIG